MRIFKVLTLLVLVIHGGGDVAMAQATVQPAADKAAGGPESELLELNERLFCEYILHHNPEPFAAVALPVFTLVAPNGMPESKTQVSSTASNLQVSSLEVANQMVLIQNDTAVLIGTLKLKGTLLGRQLPPHLTYMNVFVKADGRWRLLSRSLTPVRDPRGQRGPAENDAQE